LGMLLIHEASLFSTYEGIDTTVPTECYGRGSFASEDHFASPNRNQASNAVLLQIG
jgi:hypothetical protein